MPLMFDGLRPINKFASASYKIFYWILDTSSLTTWEMKNQTLIFITIEKKYKKDMLKVSQYL